MQLTAGTPSIATVGDKTGCSTDATENKSVSVFSLSAQTSAPRFFAQVLFSAANEGDHFVGGRVNTAPQVYVHGLVREDRSTEVKQALMSQMLEDIARIVDITSEDVWIYLQDIPATQMIEFGRFLPAPGDEAEWEKGMSPGKRGSLPN